MTNVYRISVDLNEEIQRDYLQQALDMGNRTLLMNDGNIVLDIRGKEREGMTVEDLLIRFKAGTGHQLDNDRMMLSR